MENNFYWQTEIQDEINSYKEKIDGSGDYKSGFGDGMWTILNKCFENDSNFLDVIVELKRRQTNADFLNS